MLLDIKGKELDFNCTLGVTIRIKSKFKKTYNEMIAILDKLDTPELIDFLYCGLNSDQISETEFKQYVFDNCGMGDLMDYVTWFVKQIQYPGLTEDEIEKKLEEKRQKAALLQD